jgi:plasmid stability protein
MIRNLDETVKKKLRVQAAMHGRSMEAEARAILAQGVLRNNPAGELSSPTGRFDHLVGLWKERGTTDTLMKDLRGED